MISNVNIQNSYYQALKKEVMLELDNRSSAVKRPVLALVKAISLFLIWTVFYSLFLFVGSLNPYWAILMVLPWVSVMLMIQLSVMHDASHGASSDFASINKLLTLSISFLGGSSLLWYNQHCIAHHSFTNVHQMDHDIDTGGILRLHPEQKLKKNHKYQHIYVWFLYPLFILSWIWWGDFRDLIRNTYGISRQRTKKVFAEVILIKLWHLFLFIIVPILFFDNFLAVVICYLLSFSIMGFFMVIVFQLAHVSGMQSFTKKNELGNDWVIKQVLTTANFSISNPILTWFIGGLNFQIEHHLFPQMSHLNYRAIHPTVENFCKKNQLPYYVHSSLWAATKAHYKYLKTMGSEASD